MCLKNVLFYKWFYSFKKRKMLRQASFHYHANNVIFKKDSVNFSYKT
jgi:hypothetical protein